MKGQRGFTLLEMLVTATVLLILAGALVPMAKNGVKRQKELELRRALREVRTAIDQYKATAEQMKIKAPPAENQGYPESLEILVEGAPVASGGSASSRKMRFLRRIPVDPFTGKQDWGLRSVTDEADSTSWGGSNVYDIYSQAPGVGMNGVPYREW